MLEKRYKREGYLTLSDFCRAKLVKKREIRKTEASQEFIQATQKLDYELNKIGVNLNHVAKRLNTHPVYQFSQADREVFRQVLLELKQCFHILQNTWTELKKLIEFPIKWSLLSISLHIPKMRCITTRKK